MTPQALKASILQLAIQGKLVPQRLEEGTAEELYQQIQTEKQRLIAEGKKKKEKPLPPIEESEIPFEIPETWKWVRLGTIVTKLTDGAHKTPTYTDNGIPFLSVKNMSTGVISFDNTKYISQEEHKVLYSRCNPEKGDILLSKVGTTGVPAIVDTDAPFSLFVSIALLKFSHSFINRDFLYYSLMSPLVQLQAQENTRGVGNKNWVLDAIAQTIITLPPLAEQKRIVAKIEEMLPLVERYGEAYEQLQAFNKRFPDDLRKSILQEAIQGKLVPQLPEEGTADELYQQIQAEKQRLIAAGTIKKEKPLPRIEEKDIPFDIPETWKWVRLGDCTNFGQTKQKARATDIPDNTWIADLEDIEKLSGRLLRRITTKERKIAGDKTIFNKGDILFSKLRPYLQKILVAEESGVCTSELVPFSSYGEIDPFYLVHVLKSPIVDETINTATYGMKMPRVGRDTMLNLLIPLPPHAEQMRIVAKIEKMLQCCKTLQLF